ncbi:MAG: excinuclease ABC subunit UvrC [Patescibacteria group bacterium]|nr:excinuclease ABC subunit UvrC [Patescibacteria group bacterium]
MDSQNLPDKPGVYLFKDKNGKVIYVGKAVNLKNRVRSYFQNNLLPKTTLLVSEIKHIEHIEVQSEVEALILEANLIKKFRPYYNVRLKDDKDYLYIEITKETFPRVMTARLHDLRGAKVHFGPFPNGTAVRQTLRLLRKLFPYRSCRDLQNRPCLYFHIGRCLGPCQKNFDKKEYEKTIRQIILFLKGGKEKIVQQITQEMKQAAKKLDFEKAVKLRNQLSAIEYVTTQTKVISNYLENPNLMEDLRHEELSQLKEILKLERLPHRIECFDISNIGGENATGSMVVFSSAQPNKKEYRRFKIKSVRGIDDYAMMREVLSRRFKNSWASPNLIVVDGGKGQLNAALEILNKETLTTPVISLAKREEEIFIMNRSASIKLPKESPALHLIQRLRDEAHRFALNYHRKLRTKYSLSK